MPTIGLCMGENSATKFNKCPNFTDKDFDCPYVVRIFAFTENDWKKLNETASKIYEENKKIKSNFMSKIVKKIKTRTTGN